MLTTRRKFLFAAPAIVAASSLMPISIRALILPPVGKWYLLDPVSPLVTVKPRVLRIEGFDADGSRITASFPYPGYDAQAFVDRHASFSFVERIAVY